MGRFLGERGIFCSLSIPEKTKRGVKDPKQRGISRKEKKERLETSSHGQLGVSEVQLTCQHPCQGPLAHSPDEAESSGDMQAATSLQRGCEPGLCGRDLRSFRRTIHTGSLPMLSILVF